MITVLDTLSWSPELVTGNAEFIELPSPGFGSDFGHDFGGGGTGPSIFVISNVRNDAAGFGLNFGETFGSQFSFSVLQSGAFPPAPGPGSTFESVASYIFPQPNYTFDPVAVYDPFGLPSSAAGSPPGANPVIHIVGTRNTPTDADGKLDPGSTSTITSSSQYSDVIKFTYDTVMRALAGPLVLSTGTRVRAAYDIALLPSGNQIVAMALAEPAIQGSDQVTFVSVENGIATLTLGSPIVPFVPGQWVLLDNFTNASFLNGQAVQVISATSGEFTFAFQVTTVGFGINFGSMFGSYSEPETGTPSAIASPVGECILVLELSGSGAVLSTTVIESSPSRAGNSFDALSLITNGNSIELYYQTHPKVVTFQDQIFTIKLASAVPADFGFDFGFSFGAGPLVWNLPAAQLTTYSARYSDNRLTVIADANNNRYLSQTYWNQFNHPYGILGNAFLGFKSSSGPWFFHTAFGSFMGGSVVQSTLAVSQNGAVNLVYLLQPFDQITNPPSTITAAYPLQVATVTTSPPTLDLTNVPGFYNNDSFTWLRGTKSLVDNASLWAVVGEREALTTVNGEFQTIPALPAPSSVQVDNHAGYFENISVSYASTGVPLTYVATSPAQGQYTIEPSTGIYSFNRADAGVLVAISYNYVSGIQPVYVSDFNVPPVAEITPETATVYRGGSFYSTDTAVITRITLSGSSLTVTADNDFAAGEQVAMYGIGTATYLNGILLTVATVTPTQFTASFTPQLAATIELLSDLGFGFNFGNNFSAYSQPDTGVAANLTAGRITFSAAGSTDASANALEFFWSENDPDLADVTLQSNGSQATLNVARKVGPAPRNFDVSVAVVDLEIDLATQIHPALLISNAATSGFDSITFTFAPPGGAGFGSAFGAHFGSPVPAGAIVPVVGDQIMTFGVVLSAPLAPTLGQVPGGSLPAQSNLSVIITYVNNAGETVGSDNSILSVSANHLLTVDSPGFNGTATAYNVYVGQPGSETLQTLTPQPLNSTFVESTGGLISSFTTPPPTSTALEVVLNDEVFTLTGVTQSTMTAPFAGAGNFGIDFGGNFGGSYSASFTGFAIAQFQFAVADVTVPQNVKPVITFPAPLWSAGNLLGVAAVTATSASDEVLTVTCENSFVVGETVTLSGTVESVLNGQPLTVVTASPNNFTANFSIADYTNIADTGTATLRLERNTEITITATPDAADPTTQFPVVYTGIYDPDDVVTYLWTQTGGTAVTFVGGNSGPSLSFLTNGVNINGEALTFSLTVNDGVNSPATASFTVSIAAYNFSTAKDTEQLSRSVWSQTATISNVGIASGVATVVANNSFLPGEPVRISGLSTATFLNDVVGFFVASANATQFTFATTLPNYPSTADAGTAFATVPITQRNLPQVWSPMDISVIFSDLQSVKRVSVTDGSDRYIIISPYSVLVYGVFPSANPVAVLLRRLVTPNGTLILDAVHTEQDYTLVLDDSGNIFRYTTAPLISTDDPDTTLVLANITSISFADTDLDDGVHITTTQSFANSRIVVLSGEQGALLLQLNTTTLAVQGTLEFLTADNLLYGADDIQFVRWVNMDNLHTGRVLLGSVAYNTATVSQVAISGHALTLTGVNSFVVGDEVVLSDMQNATFLNGLTIKVISATATSFTASLDRADYGPASEVAGFAEAVTSGTTYETLVDLAQGQIVGTWDKSKLVNQFVQTGEILFTPDTTYSGAPIPPVLSQPTSAIKNGKTFVTISWQQERPDLITSYIVSYAIETQIIGVVPSSSPFTVQVPVAFTFTADEGATDTSSPITITQATVSGNVITIAGTNNFAVGQGVTIGGLSGLPALIGQTLVITTVSPTQFTAPFTHANYGLPNTVANVSIASNVLTIQTGANHTFLPGTQVSFNSVATAAFLNGQTVTVVSVPTANTFVASFSHANYTSTADSGNIVDADTGGGFVFINTPLVSVSGTPQAKQYTVTPTGLYTFNAAQAGHTVSISIRQSFNALQNVGSGATQSITVALAAAQTYFFEVQAFGLDGASGESNIVSISV